MHQTPDAFLLGPAKLTSSCPLPVCSQNLSSIKTAESVSDTDLVFCCTKHFLMANLNLPGHNPSWLSYSSYLLYMEKTYPAIGRAQSSWHMWLAQHGMAGDGPLFLLVAPPALWPQPLQTWSRGNNPKHCPEQQEILSNMERRERERERHIQSSR